MLKAFGHVMYRCELAREAFEQRVGYEKLRKNLSGVVKPSEELLLEALNLVRERERERERERKKVIYSLLGNRGQLQ